MIREMNRVHTGRRRNEQAQEAILDATMDAIRRDGVSGLRIEAIARAAGVGKQTIYRWWPTRSALVAEAAMARARAEVPELDTGNVQEDVAGFLDATYRAARSPDITPVLRALVAEAQAGPEVAEALRTFVGARREALIAILRRGVERGELPGDADVDVLCDLAFGILWYRLMVSSGQVEDTLAEQVTQVLIGG
jgi:AcrR family transcriptional regulator